MRQIYSGSDRLHSTLRLIESGVQVTDAELLEALLDSVCPSSDNDSAAKNLIERYGALYEICSAPFSDLAGISGIGEKGAALLKLCAAVASNILAHGVMENKRRVFTYEDLIDYLRPHFVNQKIEKLYLLTLDSKFRILDLMLIAQGGSDSLNFDKKFVIDKAVKSYASSVVLAHNHMTSVLPSTQDIIITNDLAQLLSNLDIKLHDHIIFCGDNTKSMRKSGYIKDDKSPFFI